MKSEWKVSKTPIGEGKYMYQVYRVRDAAKTDHSGNREIYLAYQTKEEAVFTAERLNREAEI